MAHTSHTLHELPTIKGAKVPIIMSKWYRHHSEAMANKASAILRSAGCMEPQLHVLPGCLELPLAAQRLAQCDSSIEAIIAFGIILKGDTYHFDMVKDLSVQGLQRVMFDFDIPIINQILAVTRIEDAEARSREDERNKGIEAAIAAIEVIHWRRSNPLPGT